MLHAGFVLFWLKKVPSEPRKWWFGVGKTYIFKKTRFFLSVGLGVNKLLNVTSVAICGPPFSGVVRYFFESKKHRFLTWIFIICWCFLASKKCSEMVKVPPLFRSPNENWRHLGALGAGGGFWAKKNVFVTKKRVFYQKHGFTIMKPSFSSFVFIICTFLSLFFAPLNRSPRWGWTRKHC